MWRSSPSSPTSFTAWALALAGLVASAPGCSAEETSGAGGAGGGGGGDEQAVTLRFAARAGEAPLDCTSRYGDLGTEPTDSGVRDFRFYVHDVRLVTADGAEVPLALEQDGTWQVGGVALLDFEDGRGSCERGASTPAMRDVVVGTVPPGKYVGLRFRLGVPFEMNHTDVTTAPPPLNQSSMFWGWGEGRIFLSAITSRTKPEDGKLDLFAFQLASTGCVGDPRYGEVVTCDAPNRPEIELEVFDPATQVVVADLAALLQSTDLVTAPSCMGTTGEPACTPLFEHMGLDYVTGEPTPATQTFFRAAPL